MRYLRDEMTLAYESLLSATRCQSDIFQELRAAIEAVVEMDGFQGKGANVAKSYFKDVHLNVLDTLDCAILDLEARFKAMLHDFEGSVDSSAVAALDAGFISDRQQAIRSVAAMLGEACEDAQAAAGSVLDCVDLPAMRTDDAFAALGAVSRKTDRVLCAMADFDARHRSDLDGLCALDKDIAAAHAFMAEATLAERMLGQKCLGQKAQWGKAMADYRKNAYSAAFEADPRKVEAFYLAAFVDCGFDVLASMLEDVGIEASEVLAISRSGGDITRLLGDVTWASSNFYQFILLYRSGLSFREHHSDGTAYIRVSARNAEALVGNAEKRAALAQSGAGLPASCALGKFFSCADGLCVQTGSRTYSEARIPSSGEAG
jgi:hypothetical protein